MAEETKPSIPSSESPMDIVNYFFPAEERKDNLDDSPLIKISQVLQTQGISESHLKQALAVVIGLMSSRLGDPVPMVITEDEGAGAVELLDTCLNLVPEDSCVEFPINGKKSSVENGLSRGKTIISYDADSVKKELMRILVGAEHGHKFKMKKKFDNPSDAGPVSFVVLCRNLSAPILQNRYVTRIHLSDDRFSKFLRLEKMASNSELKQLQEMKIEAACSRTLLRRIKAAPISIDFTNKIINPAVVKAQNIVPVYDLMLRIIRNITRINNAPPLQPYEQPAAFIGLDFDELLSVDHETQIKPLLATKVDYYYFRLIFSDFFRSVNDYITPRQLRVFNAIFNYNMEKMYQYRGQCPTDQDKLKKLHVSVGDYGWATKDEIFEALQKDGGEKFSDTTLHNELNELSKRELIKKAKARQKKYLFKYAANQILSDPLLDTLDPSKIIDPKFKGSSVEVKNILTDGTEKI